MPAARHEVVCDVSANLSVNVFFLLSIYCIISPLALLDHLGQFEDGRASLVRAMRLLPQPSLPNLIECLY